MPLTAMEREIRLNLTDAFSVAPQADNSDGRADVDQHGLWEPFVTPAPRHSCSTLRSSNLAAKLPPQSMGRGRLLL